MFMLLNVLENMVVKNFRVAGTLVALFHY